MIQGEETDAVIFLLQAFSLNRSELEAAGGACGADIISTVHLSTRQAPRLAAVRRLFQPCQARLNSS